MATSSSTQKPTSKTSQVISSNHHLNTKKYAGCIYIGGENYYTQWFDDKEEALLELRCLEKRVSFEVIETIEMEGYYPERARIIEEKYQASGRTNGLYTGLNMSDGAVPNNTAS